MFGSEKLMNIAKHFQKKEHPVCFFRPFTAGLITFSEEVYGENPVQSYWIQYVR